MGKKAKQLKQLTKQIMAEMEQKSDPAFAVDFYTPQGVAPPRTYANFVKEGYRKNGTVYTCINKIAGAASGIKAKLYTDRTMSREITSHPLLDLWQGPNSGQGTGEFVEQFFGFWHLSGNAYIWANRPNPLAPPTELLTMRPDRMTVVPSDLGVMGYIYGIHTKGEKALAKEDVMHQKFPAYDDDYLGLSPIEVAAGLVDQQNEGNAWNTALMQNAGKPASVFFSKHYLTTEQRNQVNAELARRYSSKRNAGRPLVLEADMTWQQMSMSPYELDWLQSRELNTRDIAAIFDVAPELVGDSAGKTFANQKEAGIALMTGNVLPKLDRTFDHLNIWLVPMYPDLKAMKAYFTYDKKDIEALAELYAAQAAAKSEHATGMWNTGQCTLRQAQSLQGLPDRPGVYLDVYRFGSILVREEDLEVYAIQSLQHPSAPPAALPEGSTPPPGTIIDAVPTHQPAQLPAPKKSRETKVLDLDTAESKVAYLQQVAASRSKWESEAQSRFVAYFKDEHAAMQKMIDMVLTSATVQHFVPSVLSQQQSQLKDTLVKLYQDIDKDIGGQARQAFAESAKSRKSTVSDFSEQTLLYLLKLAGQKVTQIDATTLADLQAALAAGVAAGEGIPQLAKRIDQLYLDEIIPNRSTVIARTEVVGASNWAAMQAAAQSGLTLNKVWLATGDGRTRPDHAEADGQEVPFDQPFIVGGYAMQQPGDYNAPASEVVSCRCTVYFRRAQASSTDVQSDIEQARLRRANREEYKMRMQELMEALP